MPQIPSLFDWIERLEFLRGAPAAYLALLTALLIVVAWDWRLAIASLAVQYFAAALLYLDVLEPRFMIIKLFVGWFVCIMLYMTARQVKWGARPEDVSSEEAGYSPSNGQIRFGPYLLPGNAPFRIFLGLFVSLAVIILAQRQGLRLPAVPEATNLAVFALCGLGLVGLAMTTEPLKAGLGLLTFITGFELFYNSLDQSITMLVFLAATNFILTLTISYLAQTRHALPALIWQRRTP